MNSTLRPDLQQPPSYLVEDVTIYDPDGKQERRLSAMFTANAVMQLFAKALGSRDLVMLRQLATPDFSRGVWQRLDDKTLGALRIDGIEEAAPVVTNVEYRGAVTRLYVTQGSGKLTYVLRSWNGRLRVDDVLAPVPKCPSSLRERLELTIPIQEFAAGINNSQLELLKRNSSVDFNRLVWKQTETVPNVGASVVSRLEAPLASIAPRTVKAIVKLGDDQFGAQVQLIKEQERWVVDEVLLIAGLQPAQQRNLKKTLRIELANAFQPRRRMTAPQTTDPLRREPAELQLAQPPPAQLPDPPPQGTAEPTAAVPPWTSQHEPLRQ